MPTAPKMKGSLPLWNTKDLKPPPLVTFPQPGKDICEVLLSVQNALDESIALLRKDDGLWTSEEFVLTRMIYRFNNCLRMHKVMQSLKKVKKCVKLFRELDLASILHSFRGNLPTTQNNNDLWEEDVTESVYVPSRQLFEFTQTRLLGAGAMLAHLADCCLQIFIQSEQQMAFGVYIPNMLVFASLGSRIRVLALNHLQTLSKCYQSLQQAAVKVKASPVQWLPNDEVLPENMQQWLNDQGYTTSPSQTDIEKSTTAQNLQTDQEEGEERGDVSGHSGVSSHNISGDFEMENEQCDVLLQHHDILDVGKPVSRSAIFQDGQGCKNEGYPQESVIGSCTKTKKTKESTKTPKIHRKKKETCQKGEDTAEASEISQIRACKTTAEMLRILKQSNIRALAKKCDSDGFVKLTKMLKKFGKLDPSDLDESTLKVIRKAVLKFIKRVHKKRKPNRSNVKDISNSVNRKSKKTKKQKKTRSSAKTK